MRNLTRSQRAFTLVEIQVATVVGLMVLGLVAGSLSLVNSIWDRTIAQNDAKEILYRVESRIAPTFREALRVEPSQSNSSMAMVVLPKLDSKGNHVLPLEDGDFYHFYFSDESGSWQTEGRILWRAVNGHPDREWSMRGEEGDVNLGEFEAVFEYLPLNDPDLVRLAVATKMKSRNQEVTRQLHTEFHLRNHKYQ